MAANFLHTKKGISLDNTQTTSLVSQTGDVCYNATTNKVELYNGAVDFLVTENTTATLTNKTISGSTNTITNVS